MRSRNRLVFALALLPFASACGSEKTEPRPASMVLMTGRSGGVNDRLGVAIAKILSSKAPGSSAVTKLSLGSKQNVDAIQQGVADLGFAQADIAYVGYKQGSDNQVTRVNGIAVLHVNAVQILVRQGSDIQKVSDFKGRRISSGGSGSPTEIAIKAILESHDLVSSDVELRSINDERSYDGVTSQIRNGLVDIGVFSSGYPVLGFSKTHEHAMRLIPLDSDAIVRIRANYPFYKRVVIPRDTYRGQVDDVKTIGINTMLVCRETLPEELVYEITKVFFDSLSYLKSTEPEAELINPDNGPETSIPLHPGAARYYRERELGR